MLTSYQLVGTTKPTGSPECPPEVQASKDAARRIEESVMTGTVDDDDVPPSWEKADENAVKPADEGDNSDPDDLSDLNLDNSDSDTDRPDGRDDSEPDVDDQSDTPAGPPEPGPSHRKAAKSNSRQRHTVKDIKQMAGNTMRDLRAILDPARQDRRQREHRNDMQQARDHTAHLMELSHERREASRLQRELQKAEMQNFARSLELRIMNSMQAPWGGFGGMGIGMGMGMGGVGVMGMGGMGGMGGMDF